MVPNVLDTWLEEFLIKEADFTELRFTVSFRGQEFKLQAASNRVDVCTTSGEHSLGFIRRGGPHSGAIWAAGDCVADYFVEPDGTSVITQIRDAFRCPDDQVKGDPVLYLLSLLLVRDQIPA